MSAVIAILCLAIAALIYMADQPIELVALAGVRQDPVTYVCQTKGCTL